MSKLKNVNVAPSSENLMNKERNDRLVWRCRTIAKTFFVLHTHTLWLDGEEERAHSGLRGARPKPNSLSVRRQHNWKQLAASSVPEEAASRIVSTFFDTVNNLITPASSHSSIPLFSFRSPKAKWLQGNDLENVHRTIHFAFFFSFFIYHHYYYYY